MPLTKILVFLFVLAVAMYGQVGPAYAYLDPGSISMFFQLLVGAVAGGLVFAGAYWTKLRIYWTTQKSALGRRLRTATKRNKET